MGNVRDDHMCRFIQVASIVLGLSGTWLLAYGLKVKEGISREMRKELKLEERPDIIVPSDVRQVPCLFYSGLILISIAAIAQIALAFLCMDAGGSGHP